MLENCCNAGRHERFEEMAASMLAGCDDVAFASRVNLLTMQIPSADADKPKRRAG